MVNVTVLPGGEDLENLKLVKDENYPKFSPALEEPKQMKTL